jgi:hypothetical protein
MRKISEKELSKILENHKLWLEDNFKGERANLSGANLSGANLFGANLSRADLFGANLFGANLFGANLFGANLFGANLSRASLFGANLSGVNLSGANLSRASLSRASLFGANLSGANLSGADLSRANLSRANLSRANLSRADLFEANLCDLKDQLQPYLHKYQIVPEEGQFYGYKKLNSGAIATLLIPRSAKRHGGLVGRKCRASKVKVITIQLNGKAIQSDHDRHTEKLLYEVGKWVKPDKFDEDFTNECTHGIHFFITKKEAEEF